MRLVLALVATMLTTTMLFAQQAGVGSKAPAPVAEQGTVETLPDALLERAAALRDTALADNQAYAIVRSLTVEVGPRLAGSEGDRAAVAWALTKLKALGLANVRTMPVDVPHWDRGDIEIEITEPFPQQLTGVALGGSVGTASTGLTAPVIGFENLEALKNAPASQVAGHIVYIGDRMVRAQDGGGYATAVTKRFEGPAVAADKGARALLIRSVGTSKNRLAHTGSARYQEMNPRIPAVALTNPDADMLEAQLESGHPVSVQLVLSARMLPARRSANVIAEVPGSTESEEIVLLAAHLDSWDLGTGAIDDGAGVAIVTEVARLIAQLPEPPRRTIRVLLAANEEFGLSGARAYAAAFEKALDKHVIGLEADLGAGRIYQLESRVLDQDLPLVYAMHRVLMPLGVTLGGNRAGGGADLSPMRKLGMPVLAPRQDASEYFDFHHTANDTLDKIDREDLAQNVAVYAALTLLAAEMPERFATRPAEPPPD